MNISIRRFVPGFLLMAAVIASAWYAYRHLPHDSYSGLKEDKTHPVRGEKLASSYHWKSNQPTSQELADAFKKLDAVLDRSPCDPEALSTKIHLGLDYAPEISAAACDRVLQESPKNYFALVHGARAYLEMTNLSRALFCAAKAVQVQDGPEARTLFGDVLYSQGNTNAARKQYEQALSMRPQDEVARRRLLDLKNPR